MIQMDEKDLKKAELLARLQIEPSEREKTLREMEKLLAYAEKLNELDTEGVVPSSHRETERNSFREDTVTNGDGRELLLLNAPEHRDGQLAVPKTV